MGRLLLPMLLLAAGCATRWWPVDPLLSRELGDLRRAMGSGASGDVVVLTYDVEGHDGPWRYDVVVGPDLFAERRVELSEGRAHAFGEGRRGAWLAIGDRPARAAPPEWQRLSRTRAAIFRLGFLQPEDAEEALYMPLDGERWEYVYRPVGGRTLTLSVREDTHQPESWDVLDEFLRLTWCTDVRWAVRHGRYVPLEARCGAVNLEGHRSLSSILRLTDAKRLGRPPAWASREVAPLPPPCARAPVEIAMDEELRIHLEVEAQGEQLPFVLDSGAWHTYVDEDAARRMGVVPTGEVPAYIEPPWLPANTSWVGVIDRLVVEGVPLDGTRVFVMDGLGHHAGAAGLLGADFFRRFVVDVDTPRRVVRLVPHDRFEPDEGATPFYLRGTLGGSMMITGEVVGVDRGPLILDTGASNRLIVHAPAMAAVRPRRPGSGVGDFFADMATSPDYATDVDGLVLGPFGFPPMPAWGRDRERERLGGGIGLVGMGTMRHLRMSFDVRNRTVYASAGDGFQALVRAGVELEDAPEGGAVVSHVVPGREGWRGGVTPGDVLLAVDGRRVGDALEGRRLLATHRSRAPRLTLAREGRRRAVTVALAPPADVVNELAPPFDRSRLEHPMCLHPGVARTAAR